MAKETFTVQIFDINVTKPPYQFKTIGEIEVNVPQNDDGGVLLMTRISNAVRTKFNRGTQYRTAGNKVVACLTREEYPNCTNGCFGCDCNSFFQEEEV